jgi:hypothetical protein
VILPPLHIKLGLMTQFAKTLAKDPNSKGILYLRTKFKQLSLEKIKNGCFVGPQIRKLFNDDNFEKSLLRKERTAWIAFKDVVENFLGNKKADNYAELVHTMLESFHKMGCRMSVKLHFLRHHLDYFPKNLGIIS